MAGKTRKAGRKTRGGMCGMKHKKGAGYKKSKKHRGKKHKKGGMSILATLKQALPSYLLYQAVEMQKKKVHKRKTKGGKKHKKSKTHKKRKMHKKRK